MLNLELFGKKVLKASQQHAMEVFPKESVGFVVDNEYVPVENIHPEPEDHFSVDPKTIVKYSNKIQAIIHSHNVTQDPDTGLPRHDPFPSHNDMETQMKWNIPFGIQLVNDQGAGIIRWWGYSDEDMPPLEGRPYIHGIFDCFSLIRDKWRTVGIRVPDFARHNEWWARDDVPNNLYLDNVRDYCDQVDIKDIEPNDMLLIKIRSKVPNHAMIYEGGDIGIHHMTLGASKRESISRYMDPNRPLFHSAWRIKQEFKE